MSDVLNITMLKRLDQDNIDNALAVPETLTILLANGYASGIPEADYADVNNMDHDTLAAFKKVMDFLSNRFEAACPIWKIGFESGSKTFDFSNSYMRDTVATTGVTAMPAAQPLTVRFEFASFTIPQYVDITYTYNESISGTDKNALAAYGISVTMDGVGFNVSNERECKISFYKPDAQEGNYVIDTLYQGVILPAG